MVQDANNQPSNSQGIQFSIFGSDLQALQIILNRGESVLAELASYCYSSCDVNPYDQMNPGDNVWTIFQRSLTGDPRNSIKRFTNDGLLPGCVTFSARHNGKIIPVELEGIGPVLVHPGAFLCCTSQVTLSRQPITMPPSNRAAPLPFRQPLRWTKAAGAGITFLHAGGMLMEKSLAAGEALKVDLDHLIAFSETCKIEANPLQPLNAALPASTRMLHTCTLTGPGKLFLQSMSDRKISKNIIRAASGGRGGASLPAGHNCMKMVILGVFSVFMTLMFGVIVLLMEEQLLRAM